MRLASPRVWNARSTLCTVWGLQPTADAPRGPLARWAAGAARHSSPAVKPAPKAGALQTGSGLELVGSQPLGTRVSPG